MRPPGPAGPISRQLMLPNGGPCVGVGDGAGEAGAGEGEASAARACSATNGIKPQQSSKASNARFINDKTSIETL